MQYNKQVQNWAVDVDNLAYLLEASSDLFLYAVEI